MNLWQPSPQDLRAMLPPRPADAAKWDFGRLLIWAGSPAMPGAAALCAGAAARSGVGLVQLASEPSVCRAAACHLAESTHLMLPRRARRACGLLEESALRADAVCAGPGIGRSARTAARLAALLETGRPLVLDADALNLLAGRPAMPDTPGRAAVLTPHIAEFSRLAGLPIGQIDGDRAGHAARFAQRHGVVLVLKGPQTLVAGPDGTVWRHDLPNSGLAKGGSGDVLAGLIGGLLAQLSAAKAPDAALRAAVCGVWLHGRAGRLARDARGARGMIPSDTLACLAEAFVALESPESGAPG